MGMEMRSGKGKGMLAANRLARGQSLILIDSSFPRDGIIFPHIALHALLTTYRHRPQCRYSSVVFFSNV